MARTTSEQVIGILISGKQYDAKTTPDLTGFIETASAVVDRVITCAGRKEVILTDALLELIERWLSAHFYAHADQLFTSKSTAGASGSFQGQTGMHLESTQYGQTAMDLDYSGCLAAINKGARAGAIWLGKPVSQQINYLDRD